MQCVCAVPYCHLWPVRPYHIFPHYLINGTIFVKPSLNIKRVFRFSVQLLSEIVLVLRTIQQDLIKNVNWSSCSYSSQSSLELEFSRQIFEKYSDTKLLENPCTGSRVVPCGRKDRRIDGHDKANSRFSQFCERAQLLTT
jgi:hypothetical protein